MFKFQRHRPDKAGDKIEFKFSHLQVSQVPKGWDKLFISLISVGSGKTIAKTSKALVRHGNCQWIEVFSECKSLPQEHTPRDLHDFIFKFVVSMGSARTSILGEATLNLTDHITPRDAVPVSLPLTVYSEGPILLLSVECIDPRTKFRDERQWKEKTSGHKDMNAEADADDNRLVGSPYPDELAYKGTNHSASGSHRSSDSGDSFMGRTKLSPMTSTNGTHSQIWRQDSSGSQCSSACAPTEDASGSISSPLNPKWAGPNRRQDRNSDPLKVLLEAAQETIEELRGEARLWERKARKLKAELETLKKEHKEKSRHKEEADKRLRDAHVENERLKSSLEELQATESVLTSKYHQKVQIQRQEELEDELKFHRESNNSLSLQLKKTQESNIELVTILQELEETIEKQRLEIVIFSEKTSSEEKRESPDFGIFQNGRNDSEQKVEINDLKAKIQELERECAELSEENLGLMIKMKEPKKEKKSLEWSGTRKDLSSVVHVERSKLVECLGIALIDCNISSTCMEDMNHDKEVLDAKLNSHILGNKLLERKSRELEKSKHDLELHITELEEENVGLSECISGLEAQLRYLTNTKESSRLELENSRNQVMELKKEMQKLSAGTEEGKEDQRQKLQATQGRLSEREEALEYLKRSHSKLQATVESLIEECNSLQRLVSDLKKQKLEMHEHSTLLEFKLKESERKNADFDNRIEMFEAKISTLQKDASLKERSLLSEVETLFQNQKEQEEKLRQANDLLNQMELEKEAEVENLKKEVARLTAQLPLNQSDDQPMAFDAVEMSQLRADKLRLENSLQEAQAKVKSNETQMHSIRQELGSNIQSLVGLLNASKESEDMLMADIGRMKRQMEKMKSGEEKVIKLANELESKLKSSEYEKEQLTEEVSNLKVQLTKITQLQDEATVLKSSLDERNFEKTKLERSLELITEEREKLKAEINLCKEKIYAMQKALSDLEGDRQSRVALEEKLLRLESDLAAKEGLHAQEMELKNELSRMKITNGQYQRRIQCNEEEKDDLARKVQVLEMDVRSKKSGIGDVKRLSNETENIESSQSASMEDLQKKVVSLQTELSKALETNNVYKEQLDGLHAGKETSASNASKNSATEEALQSGGRADRLEIELKEMRERYLQMSLRYAEVEAQREDLVMKLKSTKKEKKWFS